MAEGLHTCYISLLAELHTCYKLYNSLFELSQLYIVFQNAPHKTPATNTKRMLLLCVPKVFLAANLCKAASFPSNCFSFSSICFSFSRSRFSYMICCQMLACLSSAKSLFSFLTALARSRSKVRRKSLY